MNNRVYWGAIVLAIAGILGAAAYSEAARRLPNRDGVLVAGHDGVDQQMVMVDDNGNISVEFGTSGAAFTVGGAAADDAAASGNPVPFGCHYEATVDSVDDGDIARVNCAIDGTVFVGGNIASSAVDAGNPVKIGCVYNSTLPANVVTTERVDVQCDRNGNVRAKMIGASLTGLDGHANASFAGVLARDSDDSTVRGLVVGPMSFNGSTHDREFTCPSSAVINVTAAATTEIVALTASQVIRVCSFVITGDTAATTATFVYGTGTNCDTGQAALTGAMRMVDEGHIAMSGMNGSLFRSASANAICLTAATGAVSGFMTYAKY